MSASFKDFIGGKSTLGDWVLSILGIRDLLIKRWRSWFLITILGLFIGGLYGYFHPQKHKAELLIAVEDDDSNGWQMILQQFGIDVGGNNPGGIFKGESLLKLFATRNQVEKTLLREVEFDDNTKGLLANRVWRGTPHSKKKVFENLSFKKNRDDYNSLEDSAIFLTYKYVIDEVISAQKPEKKLSLIQLSAVHGDKYLAKALTTELIDETSKYYIELLTKKARLNLHVLQKEADSVQMMMQSNMASSANSSDLNINPNRASLRIDQNRSLVDLQISVSLYGEIIKNLKLAEIGLRKQTPIIQIVDVPQFPLPKVGLKIWQWMLVFGSGFSIVFILFVSLLPEGDQS
tara:strand:- start:782 stop:1822 length:1041 start_codon:yes stop_codon:yes gene_type:complete